MLSLQDLDRIWAAQDGKHEIIVKNIHDLLVKLAWDFSPEQLDHLFGCFQVRRERGGRGGEGGREGECCLSLSVCVCVLQRCWVGASKKQCEELLEFIRHLAEDDKEGVMAVKVSTRAPPLASVYLSINTLCTHTWWCRRCWTCCGTWPTEMTVLLTRWTTPSAPTSRSLTTHAHRYMYMHVHVHLHVQKLLGGIHVHCTCI